MRRFAGPLADELSIHYRPERGVSGVAKQAEGAYRALVDLLASHHSSFRDVVSETLFLRDIRGDLPEVLAVRRRVLAELGEEASAPLTGVIGQAPVDKGTDLQLLSSAIVPRDRSAGSVRDVRAGTSCSCAGCAQSGGRLIRLGNQVTLRTTNLYGQGADTFDQVRHLLCVAEHLLKHCGMEFRDVFRTWIHLRDIDRDYDALNKARREFFRQRGVELRPASTGVEGLPFPEAHDVSLSLEAVHRSGAMDVTRLSTPTLNEAWTYGADFSRGLRLAEANRVTLHVSGTASIDEAGRSVHLGDFEAQADRMLENIATLLAQQGAGFDDLFSGVTYLKDPNDAPALRAICRERGFGRFPWVLVKAPLCRPELLCETEAVALLPPVEAGV